MDREKKEVLKLLTEVDKICKREGIPYYLSPQLTLCSLNGQGIPGPHAGNVYMRTEDMERFRLAVEREKPDRRIVESMNNNSHFYGFYLRYTDMDTLCFRINEGRNFKFPGMGINIIPLRGQETDIFKHLCTRIQEAGWNQLSDSFEEGEEKEEKYCKAFMKLRLITGRGRLGRSLYRTWCKRLATGDSKQYVLRLRKKTVYFPKKIFADTTTVELNGIKFSAPGNINKYLEKYYENGYKKKIFDEYSVRMNEMVSTGVSYEDYFQEVGNQKKMLREHRRSQKRAQKSRKKRAYLDESWEYVKFCASRIELEKYYLDQKEYIVNLYKNNDYLALEKVFAAYTRANTKSLKKDEIFVADEELEDIYLKMLEKTGRGALKEKIEKFWK